MDGAYFHILNRGIEKQKIFFDKNDYLRFILCLYRFNNISGTLRMPKKKELFIGLPKQEEKLVEVLKWILMPNHYHILVQELVSGGAVEFAKRIGNGYTKYINIKKERSGYLFQNAAKIIEVENNAHLLYLPVYIDMNAIDLIQSDWKDNGIKNKTKVKKFLREYKWSSYLDTIGVYNFLEIINKELFYKTFNMNAVKYKEEIDGWIDNAQNIDCSTWQVGQFEVRDKK